MKTIKLSEATGQALDWLVVFARTLEATNGRVILAQDLMKKAMQNGMASPSTDWAQGGPLIESESITVIRCEDDYATDKRGFTTSKRIPVWGAAIGQHGSSAIYGSQGDHWGNAYSLDEDSIAYGPAPLIAACRCYVVSRLGEEFEVPGELL